MFSNSLMISLSMMPFMLTACQSMKVGVLDGVEEKGLVFGGICQSIPEEMQRVMASRFKEKLGGLLPPKPAGLAPSKPAGLVPPKPAGLVPPKPAGLAPVTIAIKRDASEGSLAALDRIRHHLAHPDTSLMAQLSFARADGHNKKHLAQIREYYPERYLVLVNLSRDETSEGTIAGFRLNKDRKLRYEVDHHIYRYLYGQLIIYDLEKLRRVRCLYISVNARVAYESRPVTNWGKMLVHSLGIMPELPEKLEQNDAAAYQLLADECARTVGRLIALEKKKYPGFWDFIM